MAQLAGGGASAQRLLLPLTVDLTDEELEAVERHAGGVAARRGSRPKPFGGRSVVVHAVPAPHRRFDAGACFREVVADLARGRFGGWANGLERFAATFACRAAVKGGEPARWTARDAGAFAPALRDRPSSARCPRPGEESFSFPLGVGAAVWPPIESPSCSAPRRWARRRSTLALAAHLAARRHLRGLAPGLPPARHRDGQPRRRKNAPRWPASQNRARRSGHAVPAPDTSRATRPAI